MTGLRRLRGLDPFARLRGLDPFARLRGLDPFARLRELDPFARLRGAGVLGINARNREYIARHNPRSRYPLVDDKLRTREVAAAAGIRVPRLVGVVDAYGDVRRLPELLGCEADFVVKPAKGALGNGVLVVAGRDGDTYLAHDGARLTRADLAYHVSGILAGLYSIGGRVDRAMIEERLLCDPALAGVVAGGVADVRVVVFRGVPAMAMTRLPTRESRGRANLHQGAVAAGLDLGTGRAVHAIHRGAALERHPDTGRPLAGLQVPRWSELLELAARCADAVGLGYIGVDLVLDARYGPVLLEVNARPGLGIQLANRRGLEPALRAIEAADTAGLGPAERALLGARLAATAPAPGDRPAA